MIERLRKAGAPDPVAIARREFAEGAPATAAFAIARALAAAGPDASAAAVVARLADGHDPDLGVRWRLVDGEGRQIKLRP
ncbi:MAG TPA: hypothetical protein VMH24_03835 [Candidatus Sulfotelmatobacter sp.]|nr:hypothetical protein [Candidatus Sulfotelmatobacter sp.]